MARAYTTRKLEVYALHVRNEDEQVNYPALFTKLAKIRPARRYNLAEGKLVAIPTLSITGNRVKFIAYEGATGMNPLFYNFERATAREEQLNSDEVLATKTHGLIDLDAREAIVEYNQRGAKARDIAFALETMGRNVLKLNDLSVELNPVVDESFIEAIDRFERIRVAALKVARPNYDWTDNYDYLSQVSAESDARNVEIVMTANRGGSLSRNRGIIQFIKDMAAHALSILKRAHVTGIKPGETAETTVSLAQHIEHQRVHVRMAGGHVDERDIEQRIQEFMNSRRGLNPTKLTPKRSASRAGD